MDSFKKYINEEVDLVEGNIDKIKDIVSKKQHSKIDGVMVDLFTASAISQIYDKVNDANKKKMEKLPITKLADLAMKMMQKEEVELGEGVLRGRDYEVDEKEGVIKISKKNFAKVHKDFKGGDKSKPTMLALTKRGTSILSVQFTEELDIDEAKSGTGYDLYHKDFSSAMKHAYDHAKKKHGITVDSSEIDNKVATGPAKPKEGKTNTYRLKGDKGSIQVQVYNKGGSKPFELNMYKEEVELGEAKFTVKYDKNGKNYTDIIMAKDKDDAVQKALNTFLKGIRGNKFSVRPVREEVEVDEGTAQASLKSVMALDKKNAESKKQAKKYQKRDDANRKSNRAAGMEEVEVDEKLNSTIKKVIRKMAKKGTLPVRDMVKQAMSNPKNMKEEVELDEFTVSDVEIAMKKKYGKVDKEAIEKLKKVQHMGNVDRNALVKVGHGKLHVESVELDEAEAGIKVQAGPDHDRKVKRIQNLAKQLGAKVTNVGKSTDGKMSTIHVKGSMKVVNDLMKLRTEEVEVDEARGRPRKDGTKSDSDDREQIQMQLRKSISLRGLKDVVFDDGKKVKISARDARDVLGKLDAIKAPKERQNAVVHIAKSHKNLVDFAKGKSGEMDPEQRRKDAANSPFKKK